MQTFKMDSCVVSQRKPECRKGMKVVAESNTWSVKALQL